MNARRPIRIMYPSPLFPIGGAERQMLLLAEHLPRDRFDVSFVTPLSITWAELEARRLGTTVHALDAERRGGRSLAAYATSQARHVADYVALGRRERYDIVDAWLYYGYWLAALTRPLTRVPVLIAGRRSLSEFKSSFGPVQRAVDAVARRSADIVVANSRAVAQDVARREGIDPARIRVIRNGVVLPPPIDEARRRAARLAAGVGDGPVVGCVGNFRSGKGQPRLVEAMADVRRQVPEAWLVFAGDGPERERVERAATEAGLDRVRFLGTVGDARNLYAGFDVLASASDAEGLPNVVLEAAAAGCPVVATAAGGTPEIISDGETGLLVPVGDTAGVARGLVRVLTDADLARRLGAAARNHVTRAFGVARFVGETAALYEEMHERRRG